MENCPRTVRRESRVEQSRAELTSRESTISILPASFTLISNPPIFSSPPRDLSRSATLGSQRDGLECRRLRSYMVQAWAGLFPTIPSGRNWREKVIGFTCPQRCCRVSLSWPPISSREFLIDGPSGTTLKLDLAWSYSKYPPTSAFQTAVHLGKHFETTISASSIYPRYHPL